MMKRLTISALLLATLGLFAGACGGSDDSADETTTTKKDTTTTEAESSDEEESSSGDEVSDEEFEAAIAPVSEAIDASAGDVCGLLMVLTDGTTELPDPSTPTQVEEAAGLISQMFTAIADSAPPEYATEAEAIRTAAGQVETDAAEHDYDPEWFNGPDYNPISDPALEEAFATFSEVATTNCMGDMGSTETVPAG